MEPLALLAALRPALLHGFREALPTRGSEPADFLSRAGDSGRRRRGGCLINPGGILSRTAAAFEGFDSTGETISFGFQFGDNFSCVQGLLLQFKFYAKAADL